MRAVTLTPEAQPGKAPPGQMDARMRNLVSKALMVDAQPALQAGSPAQGAVALDIYDEMLPTYGKDRRYRIAYAVAPELADRPRLAAINRSEGRRVGNEGGRTGRSRGWPRP